MLSLARVSDIVLAGRPGRQRRPGPIGIDIGSDRIHLCQLRPYETARFSVLAKTSVPFAGSRKELLESQPQLRRLLREGTRKRGFVGRNVVAAMPADLVRFTPITYRSEGKDAGAVILKMLSGRVEGSIGDYIVDYLPVRTGPDQEESLALAAVAHRRDVLDFLDLLNAAGMEVDALDIGPAAIRRLLSVLYTGDEETVETILVVNAGDTRSYLSVISGRRLLFDQPVEFGEKVLLSHLAKTLDLSESASRELVLRHGLRRTAGASTDKLRSDDAEVSNTLLEILKHDFVRLVEEINRVLIFTAAETRGRPIGRICLLGSLGRWPGAEALLRELIDIPEVDTGRAVADFFVDDLRTGTSWSEVLPEMAVATGLALRGLVENE